MRRRVVITGLGTVNPLGCEVGPFWHALLRGQSGIGPIQQFDTSAFKIRFGGEVKDFQPTKVLHPKTVRHLDRFAQFALVAAIEAVTDSGLDFSREDPYRCGVIIGSGIGGLNEFEDQHARYLAKGPDRISPFVIPKMIANAASGNVSIHYQLAGPNTAVATACASSLNAMNDALRQIQWGYADVMITGGSESTITPMALGGFTSAKALSERTDDPQAACRPFDRDRDGFVLAEGAGIVIFEELERAKRRGAKIYAEVLGCGATADAFHITAPHPEGAGAARAMQLALEDGRVNRDEVDYINAHGTSTPLGDKCETLAIKQVFGPHSYQLAVSSTKSMLGHTLGGSGGIAVVACCLSLQQGVLHPTINYHTPDPDCDLDYIPNTPREVRVRRILINSFGFGGHNCSLLIGTL